MTENNYDLIAERDKLQAEVARLRVERETGVPAELLAKATTEDSARALADRLLSWKGETSPAAPPPTAPVPAYGVSQIGRDSLGYLSAEQVVQAHREGRLADIGAPAPPRRRTGEAHRNGGP
jgi:hypothetical protein